MYSISICDDDRYMRDSLEKLVREYFVSKKLDCSIRTFSSGEELSRYTGRTDIAFLDVEMGNMNGIQTGHCLMHRNPGTVIFIVTSHNQYLDDAMDLRVFRYLDKPVDMTRLYSALDIVTDQSRELSFMSHHIPVTLNEMDVVCIYSYDRKTFVLTDSGVRYPTTLSMKEWIRKTEESPYYSHPHYSYIVNIKYVYRVDGRSITLKCNNGIVMDFEASQRKLVDFKNDVIAGMRWR